MKTKRKSAFKKVVLLVICSAIVLSLFAFCGKDASKTVNYEKAYTSDEVMSDVKALKRKYPSVIKTDVIGYSQKGSPIPLIKLGNGEKKALITAGIHSREYLTISFTMRCVEEYAAAYCSDTGMYGEYDLAQLLDEYTLYIVPVSNPDGLDIVTDGQKTLFDDSYKDETYARNANGVNLNRNFPFAWEQITDSQGADLSTYKGAYAASEPETQALMKLCSENRFEWLYSMHLFGENVFWRDAENGTVPGDEELADKLSSVCGFYKSPVSTDPNGYGGGFENWFRAEFNRPALCVELVSVEREYRYEIERTIEFNTLTDWEDTRFAFIQGMQ